MNIKYQLLEACTAYANKRVENYKSELELIKDSLESSERSTDEGDDAGSSKLLNDLEKNSQHLTDAQKMLNGLKMISPNSVSETVVLGSYVKTTVNNFFISISAGKLEAIGPNVFAISMHSPIGMLLQDKSKGDEIVFNNNSFKIVEVI